MKLSALKERKKQLSFLSSNSGYKMKESNIIQLIYYIQQWSHTLIRLEKSKYIV
jgi:hypothetical protein